jgi:hypothetical protein
MAAAGPGAACLATYIAAYRRPGLAAPPDVAAAQACA